jgi:hypothetical protein
VGHNLIDSDRDNRKTFFNKNNEREATLRPGVLARRRSPHFTPECRMIFQQDLRDQPLTRGLLGNEFFFSIIATILRRIVCLIFVSLSIAVLTEGNGNLSQFMIAIMGGSE